ncbi:MAG: hypothetical protein AAF961_03955 [Planctomycetota bacterium]
MDETNPRVDAREAAVGIGVLSTLLIGLVAVVVFKIVSDRPAAPPVATPRFAAGDLQRPVEKRASGESLSEGLQSEGPNAPAASGLQWAGKGQSNPPLDGASSDVESAASVTDLGHALPAAYTDARAESRSSVPTADTAIETATPNRSVEVPTTMPRFVAPNSDNRTDPKSRSR